MIFEDSAHADSLSGMPFSDISELKTPPVSCSLAHIPSPNWQQCLFSECPLSRLQDEELGGPGEYLLISFMVTMDKPLTSQSLRLPI
jgi:hypothetical protein